MVKLLMSCPSTGLVALVETSNLVYEMEEKNDKRKYCLKIFQTSNNNCTNLVKK